MKKKLFRLMAAAAILLTAACSKPEIDKPAYIPDDEEEEGSGQTPGEGEDGGTVVPSGRGFYIFDCLAAYKGKPDDLSSDKFSKCQLIYEAFLLDENKNQLDMTKVRQQVQLAKLTGASYISTDIEEWYSTRDAAGIKQGLQEVFNEFKKGIPGCIVGNYGVPVSDLNVMRYSANLKGQTEAQIIERWKSTSQKRMPAAEVSDVLYPSMYTHTDGSNADPITQYEKDVKTTADYLKQNFPGKKIYAYIWPQFYNLHMTPNDSFQKFMTADQWTRVLEVCYRNFDGVIMWCHGRDENDTEVQWSDSRVQSIYAATKRFVSKYYDDIAVAAGAAGGDVTMEPTEFNVYGSLGFTDTPRNLLKFGVQPINAIKESDVSEPDKVDGVLPPNLNKIKHVAKNASYPVIIRQSSWIGDRSNNKPAMEARFQSVRDAFKAENQTVTLGYLGIGPTGLTELAAWNDYVTEFARKDSWLRYAVEPCRGLRQFADVIYPNVTLINDDLEYWKNDTKAVLEEARLDNPGKKIIACLGTTYYGNPNKANSFAYMFDPVSEQTLLEALEFLYVRCDGIVIFDNVIDEKRSTYSEDLGFMKALARFYANHKSIIDKTLPSSVLNEDDIPPFEEGGNSGDGGADDKVYRESITNGGFEDAITPTFVQADWTIHKENVTRLARLASYFDKTAQATRPTTPSGTTVADGQWFHRCANNSWFWHNYIDDTDKPYTQSYGVARAHTGKKSICMYAVDGAAETNYSSHKGNLQHLFGIGQTLSLNDAKKYTMKFWYYRPSTTWFKHVNNVKKIVAGIISSNGATASPDYTWEKEITLSTSDAWTEVTVTFDLPAIIAANPGKSFEKCAIFINIVPELDPTTLKTVKCHVNIDDVSMSVVQ